LDWLAGKVVALGRKYGIPTPAQEAVYAILKPYRMGRVRESIPHIDRVPRRGGEIDPWQRTDPLYNRRGEGTGGDTQASATEGCHESQRSDAQRRRLGQSRHACHPSADI